MSALGYFGKAPARGDFIGRGLPRSLTDGLERWAKAGLAEAKERDAEGWLDAYLVSPVWRFAGGLGDALWTGVLCPSVDAAGRYFPLAIAAEVAGGDADGDLEGPWFDAADAAVRDALAPESFDLALWSERIDGLDAPDTVAADSRTSRWRGGADGLELQRDGALFDAPYADFIQTRAGEAGGLL
ncbi:MAG: type VI secretion system-associated protein TagF [Pseudomonadota bacterium]